MRGRRQALSGGRWIAVIGIATAALLVTSIAGLAWGSSGIGGLDLLGAWASGEIEPTRRTILVEARLPRVVFAALVGAALAAAGAVFQAVLRNPLADPYILGVSGGAALGGTVMMSIGSAAGWIWLGVPGAAFVGAMGAIGLIMMVGRWSPGGRTGTYVLLLTGVIFNAFAAAVIMFLKSIVTAQKAQELLFYLMGSLAVEGTSTTETLVVGAIVLAALIGIGWFARDLNVLSLGDDEAASLGVSVERTRWWSVSIASVAVAIAVAYTGLIGFVGLVVPHGIRLLVGPDHRLLIPTCALGGAAFLIVSDLLARSAFGLFATALPVGVVTAFIGAPLFVFFLRRSLLRSGGAS